MHAWLLGCLSSAADTVGAGSTEDILGAPGVGPPTGPSRGSNFRDVMWYQNRGMLHQPILIEHQAISVHSKSSA